MLSSISGIGSYFVVYRYSPVKNDLSAHMGQGRMRGTQGTGLSGAQPPAAADSGVQALKGWGGTFSSSVYGQRETGDAVPDLFIRKGADPAEYAVRMRMQYMDPEASDTPGQEAVQGSEDARETAEDGKCQTCEQRKYQDGSNDMGVSFKTPTHIAPEAAGAAVRGHEQEHVMREQAKALREGRRVISQSVMLHTDICPECGKVYISGGTTRTTTASALKPEENAGQEQTSRRPFSAVA